MINLDMQVILWQVSIFPLLYGSKIVLMQQSNALLRLQYARIHLYDPCNHVQLFTIPISLASVINTVRQLASGNVD